MITMAGRANAHRAEKWKLRAAPAGVAALEITEEKKQATTNSARIIGANGQVAIYEVRHGLNRCIAGSKMLKN